MSAVPESDASLSIGRAPNAASVIRAALESMRPYQALGSGSGIVSVLMLTHYMQASPLELSYGRSEFIWVTSALLLYWISYMWLTAHRGRMTDDPLVFALKDRVSQVLIALMGATAWLAV